MNYFDLGTYAYFFGGYCYTTEWWCVSDFFISNTIRWKTKNADPTTAVHWLRFLKNKLALLKYENQKCSKVRSF